MTPRVQVRSTESGDRPDVLRVVEQAFTTDELDATEELAIVRTIWDRSVAVDGLDLVATVGDQIVGHVLASWGSLGGAPVVGVAPLSVTPAHQRQGTGTALMRTLIERTDAAGLPALVLLGDHGYYRRFGFEPAAPHGFRYRPAGPDSPHFQVRRLASYRSGLRGEYTYSWEQDS